VASTRAVSHERAAGGDDGFDDGRIRLDRRRRVPFLPTVRAPERVMTNETILVASHGFEDVGGGHRTWRAVYAVFAHWRGLDRRWF